MKIYRRRKTRELLEKLFIFDHLREDTLKENTKISEVKPFKGEYHFLKTILSLSHKYGNEIRESITFAYQKPQNFDLQSFSGLYLSALKFYFQANKTSDLTLKQTLEESIEFLSSQILKLLGREELSIPNSNYLKRVIPRIKLKPHGKTLKRLIFEYTEKFLDRFLSNLEKKLDETSFKKLKRSVEKDFC